MYTGGTCTGHVKVAFYLEAMSIVPISSRCIVPMLDRAVV